MYKENDNLNKEEIDKFRSMSQTERDKLLAEKENGIIRYIAPQPNLDDVEYYFSLAKKNKFGILRVDDKDITTDISKLSATVRW